MFTSNDIKAKVRTQPFVPFRVITSSGAKYDIHHPEMVFIGHRDIQIGTEHKDDPTVYDQVVRLALLHITAIEDIAHGGRRRNGAKDKR